MKEVGDMPGIVFEASDEEYALARQNYGKINAEGKYKPISFLHASDGKYYQLPNPFMFKEYVADIEALLYEERHLLLTETSEKAKETTEFYAGVVEYQVLTHLDLDSVKSIDEWIYAENEILEL